MRHKVHPLTPLLKSFAAIAAIVAFGFANLWQLVTEVGTLLYEMAWVGFAIGVGIAVVAIVVIAFFSWLSWRFTFYELTDDEVRYGSGWLIRSRRAARLDRVQAVDINRPLLPRIFGLAEIVIETAGGKDSHFKIQYLTPEQCDEFRAEVLKEVENLDTELSRELYGQADAAGQAGATGQTDPSHPAATANAGAPGLRPAADTRTIFGPIEVGQLAASVIVGPALFIIPAIIVIAIVAGIFPDFVLEILTGITVTTLIIVITFAFGLFGVLNQSWDFTLKTSSISRRLSITAGLLSTRAQTIPIDRVHGIKVVQPLWWRHWKWSRAEVSVAGYDVGDSAGHNTLVPVAGNDQLRGITEYLMTEIAGVAPQDDLLGTWETPRAAWWLSPIDWKYQKVEARHRGLLVTKGRFWHTQYIVPWQRIQGHTLSINPFEKAAGVGNVTIDMVPGAVTPVAAQLKLADAYELAGVIEKHKVV
jgi:putative membrane protein